MCELEGVLPLVCPVCERVVGVINAAEVPLMVASGEVYVCAECMRRPESFMEWKLAQITAEDWEALTRQAIVYPYRFTSAELRHTVPLVYAAGGQTMRVGGL